LSIPFLKGRCHGFHQPTSYVSNNVLLCMAEVLYHMSRSAMLTMANKGNARQWRDKASAHKDLVIFEAHRVDDLIYLDTSESRTQANPVASAIIVHPDCLYEPVQHASDHYRGQGKIGVVYPSARHSRDFAIALFLDRTSSIRNISAVIDVCLTLLAEDETTLATDPRFNPYEHMISHTKGRYDIDPGDLASCSHLLYPALPRASGIVDFVRRPYHTYPNDAVSP
jgi:hypothetical protein